jgi:hypothetical protein
VRRRTDVNTWDLVHGHRDRPAPPDEVAKDPARLALWEEEQREHEASWNSSYEVFEARGCEHQVLQYCDHPSDQNGTSLGLVSCSEGDYPPGARTDW